MRNHMRSTCDIRCRLEWEEFMTGTCRIEMSVRRRGSF